MSIEAFLQSVISEHKTSMATEHSYRPALKTLFETLGENITAINEAKRVKTGAPDLNILKNEISIGLVEAKDIGVDLQNLKGTNKDQFERYRKGFDNLIYTNCMDWDFYLYGERVASVSIGAHQRGLQPKPENFAELESLLQNFITQTPLSITSPADLAKRMANKADITKNILANILKLSKNPASVDDRADELQEQYQGFKENLIHDISEEDFADIYAETIAYGLFAARLHDPTLDTFSRQEALELIPKSSPFLRDLFQFIAGYNLDFSWTYSKQDDILKENPVSCELKL